MLGAWSSIIKSKLCVKFCSYTKYVINYFANDKLLFFIFNKIAFYLIIIIICIQSFTREDSNDLCNESSWMKKMEASKWLHNFLWNMVQRLWNACSSELNCFRVALQHFTDVNLFIHGQHTIFDHAFSFPRTVTIIVGTLTIVSIDWNAITWENVVH